MPICSADFIRILFLCLHLLINSDFLFNRLTQLKCFKSYIFSVEHNLQTSLLGQHFEVEDHVYPIQIHD